MSRAPSSVILQWSPGLRALSVRSSLDAEVQAWISAVADGSFVAPRSATAWDGYAAAAVCEAAEASLMTDGAVEVTLRERPGPDGARDGH